MQSVKRLSFAVLAGVLFAIGVNLHAASTRPEEVKVGFAAPLTGPQALYGKDMQDGVILAVEDFNATRPVINGKPVKIVLQSEDDQADPRIATTIAQRLVDSNIKGMIGHFNSGTTIPASRIYAAAGIPEIAMATAPEYTRQGFKTTFRMMTSDIQQGSVVGNFAVKTLKFKKIAIIDDRTAYGQGLADEFAKAAKAAGATIIDREFTNDKALDFKSVLTKLKSKQPAAIFFGGAFGQAAPMIKQMRSLGIQATFISGDMSRSDAFIKLAGKAANGAIASQPGLPLDQMPGRKDYVEKYKKRFGTEPQTYSPYAYDGAMAMFNAMKKADSTDPAKYLPVLAQTRMPAVTTKQLAYNAHGDLKKSSITVYKVVDGKWTTLKTVSGK